MGLFGIYTEISELLGSMQLHPGQRKRGEEWLLEAHNPDEDSPLVPLEVVLKRHEEMLGRWELFQVKPFLGSGTDATFERYEFQGGLRYKYESTRTRSYVASPFAPDAGNSVYAGPADHTQSGWFLPGLLVPKGGFKVLLLRSGTDDVRETTVRAFRGELQIGATWFKRG